MSHEPETPVSSTKPASDATEAATPEEAKPAFGWTAYAEKINGRFAMVGFIALLILELITRQDFFTWLGLP